MKPPNSPLNQRPASSNDDFLEAMSKIASTVNIVTTDGRHGRAGMTVTAMTSVSASDVAPSLLVCLNRSSGACSVILKNGCFCVNSLRESQAYMSDFFAGRFKTSNGDKFSCARWVPASSGSPRLTDSLVTFDCLVSRVQTIGTHQVVFGRVIETFKAETGAPLIYVGRNYGQLKKKTQVRINSSKNQGSCAFNNAA